MTSLPEPSIPQVPGLSGLPDFLFGAWRLRALDISEAEDRDELRGWTVSSLCSTYFRYQLERHQRQLEAQSLLSAPSLASASVKTLCDRLSLSTDLEADVRLIGESLGQVTLRRILQDPRTPYVIFRMFEASPHTSLHGGTRKISDVDEAILTSEQDVRSQDPKPSNLLVTLEDLQPILGAPDQHGITTFRRKDPPKGGFEFLDQKRKRSMQIVGTDALFKETLGRVTNGCLDGLDWQNVFIVGGMVLNTLLHTNAKDQAQPHGRDTDVSECDIDLYLYDLTPEEANKKVEHIYEVWYKNTHGQKDSSQPPPQGTDQMIVKTAKTISFIPTYPVRRVQIILKIMPSPLDLLLNVDLDACALGFDGSRVLMLPRAARALETGYSTFTMDLIWGHHLGNRRETQEPRVFKYADRGFGLRILPSYVRSLEETSVTETEYEVQDVRSGPTRVFESEPGLKTLRRIAHMAQDFVQRLYLEFHKPKTPGGDDAINLSLGHAKPLIDLPALDGQGMHSGLPDHLKGLAFFEVFMRHCAAWRMDAIGIVRLDPSSFGSNWYEEENQYTGLPTYDWGPSSTTFQPFITKLEDHNDHLFWTLRKAIAEKLSIGPRDGRYVGYLTRRIRRMIGGSDLEAVHEKQITMPLIIPMELEVAIAHECANDEADPLPPLILVHNPQKYDPRNATLPSLQDTVNDSGNLRYWLVTNENMWAHQSRVADEVSELLETLFDWFLHRGHQPGYEPPKHGTDSKHCIWRLAKAFRRRLILPEESDKRERGGQTLSNREARLFRPWALTRPPRVKRHDDREAIDSLEDELEKEGDIPDSIFWNAGDEGTWRVEEGVPMWTEG
ncbi:MAG: hypothetical protein LQ339_006829 [Xanthoria mediterranea]|nr:MAG: hypothetical protein LQ339_006829 [Xanthoria mediterranea]